MVLDYSGLVAHANNVERWFVSQGTTVLFWKDGASGVVKTPTKNCLGESIKRLVIRASTSKKDLMHKPQAPSKTLHLRWGMLTPGPLVKSTNELIQNILKETYNYEKNRAFVQKFFHPELGNASKRVVDDLILPSLARWNRREQHDKKKLVIPTSRKDLFEQAFDQIEKQK